MLGSRVQFCHESRVCTSTGSEYAGHLRHNNGRRVPARLTCIAFAPDRLNNGQNAAQQHNLKLGRQKNGKLHRQTSEKSGIVNIVPYTRRDRIEEHTFQQTSPAHHTEKSKWDGVHRPVFLVLFSAHLLYTVCQLSGVRIEPSWAPTAVGGFIGMGFTLLCRHGRIRHWQKPSRPLNVLITGSSRGIGKALARLFLTKGDCVFITSSKASNVLAAVEELQDEVATGASVFGAACDVSEPQSIRKLVQEAKQRLGHIDVWINNAGYSGCFQEFTKMSDSQLSKVVNTNLLGCLLCTRAPWRLMREQPTGGHIFNMDGAGANGSPTPQYAAYGATKAGIAHLLKSLNQEILRSGNPVKVHNLSPGMVLTPLLLEGATEFNKRIFNILCEQPETAAAYLVPRVRSVAAGKRSGRYIRYLTLVKALRSFLTAPLLSNRFFNEKGEPVYQSEKIRLSSAPYIRRFVRQARSLARQDGDLALAYSLSLTASYLLLVAESCKLIPKLPFS